METRALASFTLLAALLGGCQNCRHPVEDSGFSDLPHTEPANWEFQRNLPGQP